MWMTSGAHGLPTAVVSLLPIVVFTTLSVLSPTDIRGLPWDVLFLLAGGLVLGDVVKHTGLANWLVAMLPVDSLGATSMALILAYAAVALANFMSHTAASNILLPIGVSLASGMEARIALPVAFAASAAMCLPIATPPNALVFATGHITTKDLARLGIVLGIVTPALAVFWIALWR
jgi:sodium-dependent dicarboxylate transporter 2/3/5